MNELIEKQLPCYIWWDTLEASNVICIYFSFTLPNSFLAVLETKETMVYEVKSGFYVKKLAKKLFVS